MTSETEWLLLGVVTFMIALPGWVGLWLAWHTDRPTYSSMEQTIGALSEQVREMHAEMSRLQVRVAELTAGVRILTSQLRSLGAMPDYLLPTEGPEGVSTMDALPEASAVYERLVRSYGLNDLNDLAFSLGISVDELGESTLSGRARALVEYVQRRDQLPDLLSALRTKRPTKPQF